MLASVHKTLLPNGHDAKNMVDRCSAARGVGARGDQRGVGRPSCAGLGAGHLFGAGWYNSEGVPVAEAESMRRQFRPPALSPLPSREKVSLGPE